MKSSLTHTMLRFSINSFSPIIISLRFLVQQGIEPLLGSLFIAVDKIASLKDQLIHIPRVEFEMPFVEENPHSYEAVLTEIADINSTNYIIFSKYTEPSLAVIIFLKKTRNISNCFIRQLSYIFY